MKVTAPCPPDGSGPLAGHLPEIAFVELLDWRRARIVKSHAHPDQYQLDYFAEGGGSYTVDGTTHPIRQDRFYFVPPGRKHGIIGSNEQPPVNLTVKFRHPGLRSDVLPDVTTIVGAQADRAERLLREVISEFVLDLPERKVVAALRLTELLLVLRESQRGGRAAEHSVVAMAKPFMAAHLSEPIGLDAIAKAVDVSREHLCRVFRRETGETPLGYLRALRIERAKQFLVEQGEPLGIVAARTGFTDARDFHRVFKRLTGTGPRDYRRQARLAAHQRVALKKRP